MTTLPPIETTPVLLVSFSPKASARLVELVEERLKDGGMLILSKHIVAGSGAAKNNVVLVLTTTQQALETTAESIHLVKRSKDHIMERFVVSDRTMFCRKNDLNRDEFGLFSSCERTLLVFKILCELRVIDRDCVTSELSEYLQQYHNIDPRLHFEEDISSNQRSVRHMERLRQHKEQSASLRQVLQAHGFLDHVTAVNLPKLSHQVLQTTWRQWFRLDPPVDDIQDYFGWEIAIYFAWMGHMTRWLVFPAVVGVLVTLLRWYRKDTLDEDEYTPFYGLITFVWAVLLLRFWDRQEHRLSHRWGTFALSSFEKQKYVAVRPEFYGYLRESPVTGGFEIYYPPLRRRLKYIVSAIVTLFMLSIAFSVMILSLNLQGYIRPKSNPTRWNEESPHPFHFGSLAIYAEPGHLFDATSSWRSLLPVLVHVVCIFILNYLYRIIAERLTSWENHETDIDYRNSIILKRFLFEAFDCYIALFYLAFYERDVYWLRRELVSVFQIDSFRRVLNECGLPLLLQYFTNRPLPVGKLKKKATTHEKEEPLIPSLETMLEDLRKDPYEQFDDYMEMLIQLGYVILFASAYPLASLISIAANWVEMRADMHKISQLCQRPIPLRQSDIGMWRALMASLVWMSALTNCLLAGFTSDQLMHYMPSFYIHDRSGFTTLEHDKGWLVILVIFGLEHVLVVVGLLIYFMVPDIPEDVSNELEKCYFVQFMRQYRQVKAASFKKKD